MSDGKPHLEEIVANDAYDKHLEAGEAMDSLLHVDWEKQPEYGQELIEAAIEGFEAAIEELETIKERGE